ncbi:MAG: YdcF family protein [Acidobacteriia bacterium]|nr:YdcF family protein [Terriglobia bacterium]
MPETDNRPLPRRRPCCWTLLVIGVLAFLFLLAATAALYRAGRWLLVQDPLQKAAAIAVLSGRMPLRAEEAAALYRDGWAPQVWITHAPEPGRELQILGIDFVGEDFYSVRVLLRLGVPADAIRVLPSGAVNTAAELDLLAKQLEQSGGRSLIVVTSKSHTRRVRTLWRMLAKPGQSLIVRPAADDPFDPAHWWRTSGDALEVVRELLGLANAWAGLPLHARQ